MSSYSFNVYPTRLLFIVSVFSKLCSAFSIGAELPCDFHDSINITDGIHHFNGSIFFNGLEFTPDQYIRTNHNLTKSMQRIRVEHYTRGCICNVKPCYRFCCLHAVFLSPSVRNLTSRRAYHSIFRVFYCD